MSAIGFLYFFYHQQALERLGNPICALHITVVNFYGKRNKDVSEQKAIDKFLYKCKANNFSVDGKYWHIDDIMPLNMHKEYLNVLGERGYKRMKALMTGKEKRLHDVDKKVSWHSLDKYILESKDYNDMLRMIRIE